LDAVSVAASAVSMLEVKNPHRLACASILLRAGSLASNWVLCIAFTFTSSILHFKSNCLQYIKIWILFEVLTLFNYFVGHNKNN
jgi:hypothetical protein